MASVNRSTPNGSPASFNVFSHQLARRGERRSRLVRPGVRVEELALGQRLEGQLWTVAPGTQETVVCSFRGEQLVHVLHGTLCVWVEELEALMLEPGDTLYLSTATAYRWRNVSRAHTVFLWAVASDGSGAAPPQESATRQ